MLSTMCSAQWILDAVEARRLVMESPRGSVRATACMFPTLSEGERTAPSHELRPSRGCLYVVKRGVGSPRCQELESLAGGLSALVLIKELGRGGPNLTAVVHRRYSGQQRARGRAGVNRGLSLLQIWPSGGCSLGRVSTCGPRVAVLVARVVKTWPSVRQHHNTLEDQTRYQHYTCWAPKDLSGEGGADASCLYLGCR